MTSVGMFIWPDRDPVRFPYRVELTRRVPGGKWRLVTLSRHATKLQAMREMCRCSASLPAEQYLAVREGAD